jgi:hypothetical protein
MKNTKLNHGQSFEVNKAAGNGREGARRCPAFTLRLLGLGALLLAGGCTLRESYPATQIRGYINGEPFSVSAPKDSTLAGFDATAATNGAIHVHIDSLQSALNPTNLANAANGQAAIITATAQAINQAIVTAGAAAAKAAQ